MISTDDYEQLGPEGKRIDGPAALDKNSGLIYFGNRLCPYANRVWWSALEKNIRFDQYIHIDLGNKKPSWYQEKINPYGTVPTLSDSGKLIFESLVIAQFLEDKYPHQGVSLLGKDIYSAAAVRVFIDKLSTAVTTLYDLLKNQDKSKEVELQNKIKEALQKLNKALEAQSQGPYFLGKDLSLADIALIPFLDRFKTTLKHYRNFDIFSIEKTDRVKTVYETASSRPAFKVTQQTPEFYIQVYSKYANPSAL